MKRMHVHVSVADLGESVRFYSTMFGAEPSVLKPDYAKWMLDDPRVNFAISAHGHAPGLDHLGVQAETPDELREIAGRLAGADRLALEQKNTTCCYSRSDKAWATDPSGLAWESFFTFGETTVYGEGVNIRPSAEAETVKPAAPCCAKADP